MLNDVICLCSTACFACMTALRHHRARDRSGNPAEGFVRRLCGGVVTDSPARPVFWRGRPYYSLLFNSL